MRMVCRLFVALVAIGMFVGFASPAHAASGRWVDVNLSTQHAQAYQGNTVVRQMLVTTGRPGFATPTGTFYIQYRVASETMDSATVGIPRSSPNGYYVTGVPYTQYFDSYGDSLHGNWWSPASAFGNYPTSHGCVGLTVADAAWMWNWATYGTPVVIHY